MSDGETDRDNPLDRGGSTDLAHTCDGCGKPTNKTPIPVRQTSAVDLYLCESCEVAVGESICDCPVHAETSQEGPDE